MDDLEINLRQKLQKLTKEVHRINELTGISTLNYSRAKMIVTAISDQIKMASILLLYLFYFYLVYLYSIYFNLL